MPKERPTASNMTRVSPYPLHSSRTQREIQAESPIQNQGPGEWEEIKCVICMEPPHNAVLLKCSSFSKGCRTYMCDTSGRHSNFWGSYSQIEKHLKADHPRFSRRPLVDAVRQRAWDEMQRGGEYTEIMTAAGLPPPPHRLIQISVNGVVRNYLFTAPSPHMPTRVDIQAVAIFPS